ncbi:MAG TPA: AarF/ABC1/UbiB kinase family protein, partial [Acidimicrobiales bacterium]|nr:AarF/ABC1/UbiB kinase family protein [Acidimicrobiales bacterium]
MPRAAMSPTLKAHHLARYRDVGMLLVKYGRAGGIWEHATGDSRTVEDDARQLTDELEAMGPTFVKLGQLLSTRSDLLHPAYLEALARLQDDVERVPFDEIAEVVSSEIGTRISKAFQSFDETPKASASIGQVHRAVLRDGREVAVKVQRPGVRRRVIDDMEVIEELAAFVDGRGASGRAFDLPEMVEQFRRSIMAELDYRLEASNLRLLGSNLARYDRLVVPQPIEDYSSSLVLTTELVDGRNVGSLGPLARLETDGAPLAGQLFDAYLDQILVDGFVHADPHPGNVLLTVDGRLALVDLGMV